MSGSGSASERRGIPRRPIFWTLDQVADMLSLSEMQLVKSYVWFQGQEVGPYRKHYLRAVDLNRGLVHAERGRPAVNWRIAENELVRWMTFHKLWLYDDPTLMSALPDSPRNSTAPVPSEGRGTLVDIKLVDLPPLEGTEEEDVQFD